MDLDISKIINLIDERLAQSGRDQIDAPKANEWLQEAGLLKDSAHRPGLPLRNLLRAGLLPHAYQPGGKNTRWTIVSSKETYTVTHS